MVLVNFIELSESKAVFTLSTSNPAVANSLRRVLLAEVPCLAIDIVEVKHNTGVMVDEMLSHRIGLVPIISDVVDTLVYPSECKCFIGCSKCSIRMELNKENTSTSIQSVYASDIIPDNSREMISQGNQKILLTRLGPGQRIHCIMWAKKGIAKTHAKWSTVSTAVYKFKPIIEITQPVTQAISAQVVKACPTKVFDMSSSGELDIEDLDSCTFCGECSKIDSRIKVQPDESNMVFTVESLGQHSAMTIIKTAISVMIQKLKTIKAYIGDTKEIVSETSYSEIEF